MKRYEFKIVVRGYNALEYILDTLKRPLIECDVERVEVSLLEDE